MSQYRARRGKHTTEPTITVPRTLTQSTYINVLLAQFLDKIGMYDSLNIGVDVANREILLTKPTDTEYRSYKVRRTGVRGYCLSPRLRKYLPAGRYALYSSDESTLKFKKV